MPTEFEHRREKPTATSKGLPVISRDTVASILQTYTSHENWGEHLTEVQRRLIEENPILVEFIESQVGKFPEPLHLAMFEVVVGTIAVLEHQAEANKLSTYLNIDTKSK